MDEEEQRIAILKAMGWTETEPWLDGRRCFERADSNSGWNFDDLPDYLNDLNAIHEVENKKLVSHAMWDSYLDNLESICERENLGRYITNATAAQRAEAILKTLGKWEGGEDA